MIAAQILLGNWDLKAENNRIYERAGAPGGRQFVVRDLGASLGSSRQHPFFAFLKTPGRQGTKNDIEGFERQGFLTGVDGGRVSFDYRGLNRALLGQVSALDVRWACERLSLLSDAQWRDVFRAGEYAPALAARFVAKIKERIAQGLAIPPADPR